MLGRGALAMALPEAQEVVMSDAAASAQAAGVREDELEAFISSFARTLEDDTADAELVWALLSSSEKESAVAAPSEQCRTAVVGDACHAKVRWAKTIGIRTKPEWYRGLTRNSTFEEIQEFLSTKRSSGCARPCARRTEKEEQSAQECHTAVVGDECHTLVKWARLEGFPKNPEWYPGLTKDSTFEDFQAFLHGQDEFSRTCAKPCEAKRAEMPSTEPAASTSSPSSPSIVDRRSTEEACAGKRARAARAFNLCSSSPSLGGLTPLL